MGAAFQDLAPYRHFGHRWIVAFRFASPTRIGRHATARCRLGRRQAEPVGGPLPDVADHVEQAVAIGGKGAHGRRSLPTVVHEVLPGEPTLPVVGEHPAFRRQAVAPGEFSLLQPPACGVLPFGLGRQRLAGPGRVGLRVFIGDVNDRMIIQSSDGASGAQGLPPPCPRLEPPPLGDIAHVDRSCGRHEDQRACDGHLRRHAWVVGRIRRPFGEGPVTRRCHESSKPSVSDRTGIDQKRVDLHLANRPFLRIVAFGSHVKGSARQVHHGLRTRLPRRRFVRSNSQAAE
ncbi:hypothetical protein D3C84_634410 [compost metagenome]